MFGLAEQVGTGWGKQGQRILKPNLAIDVKIKVIPHDLLIGFTTYFNYFKFTGPVGTQSTFRIAPCISRI